MQRDGDEERRRSGLDRGPQALAEQVPQGPRQVAAAAVLEGQHPVAQRPIPGVVPQRHDAPHPRLTPTTVRTELPIRKRRAEYAGTATAVRSGRTAFEVEGQRVDLAAEPAPDGAPAERTQPRKDRIQELDRQAS